MNTPPRILSGYSLTTQPKKNAAAREHTLREIEMNNEQIGKTILPADQFREELMMDDNALAFGRSLLCFIAGLLCIGFGLAYDAWGACFVGAVLLVFGL